MNQNRDAHAFVSSVANIRSTNAFNPYCDVCEIADTPNSPTIRTANLVSVLDACLKADRCSLWIARDLGYRGGRRTGVPLTDEVSLHDYGSVVGASELKKATVGPVVAERTAHITHSLVRQLKTAVFMWNIFPLHPHDADDPMTNRRHTALERDISQFAIEWLVKNLQIDFVVAIGRDAQAALSDMDVEAFAVRHPSYGGQKEFCAGIAEIYNAPLAIDKQLMLI